jgi:hypothetical protein
MYLSVFLILDPKLHLKVLCTAKNWNYTIMSYVLCLRLPMWFIAEGNRGMVYKCLFSCFSNTELIILGGVVAGGASKLVEKYDIQTGNCMSLYISICLT